jgi:hypothetical protein
LARNSSMIAWFQSLMLFATPGRRDSFPQRP